MIVLTSPADNALAIVVVVLAAIGAVTVARWATRRYARWMTDRERRRDLRAEIARDNTRSLTDPKLYLR